MSVTDPCIYCTNHLYACSLTASTPTIPELLKFTCADNTKINITKRLVTSTSALASFSCKI